MSTNSTTSAPIQNGGSIIDNPGPSALVAIAKSAGGNVFQTSNSGLQPMAPQQLSLAGGGLPHQNMQPYLTLNFCIALQGVFPPRP